MVSSSGYQRCQGGRGDLAWEGTVSTRVHDGVETASWHVTVPAGGSFVVCETKRRAWLEFGGCPQRPNGHSCQFGLRPGSPRISPSRISPSRISPSRISPSRISPSGSPRPDLPGFLSGFLRGFTLGFPRVYRVSAVELSRRDRLHQTRKESS